MDVIFAAGFIVCSGSPSSAAVAGAGFLLLPSTMTAAATAGKLFRLCDRTCLPFGCAPLLVMSAGRSRLALIGTTTTRPSVGTTLFDTTPSPPPQSPPPPPTLRPSPPSLRATASVDVYARTSGYLIPFRARRAPGRPGVGARARNGPVGVLINVPARHADRHAGTPRSTATAGRCDSSNGRGEGGPGTGRNTIMIIIKNNNIVSKGFLVFTLRAFRFFVFHSLPLPPPPDNQSPRREFRRILRACHVIHTR